jgi:hypothetical protein
LTRHSAVKSEKGGDPPFGGWLLTAEWRVKAFEGDLLLLFLKKNSKGYSKSPVAPFIKGGKAAYFFRSPLTAHRSPLTA